MEILSEAAVPGVHLEGVRDMTFLVYSMTEEYDPDRTGLRA